MELFNRTFTSTSVAMATGLEPKAIQNWVSRGLIIGHREAEGKGHHVKYSWFNLMEIALAAELIDIGISIQDAFAASQRFSHFSSGSTTCAGDGGISEEGRVPFRDPGMPWHHMHGATFLFLWKGDCGVRLLDMVGNVDLALVAPSGRKTAYVALDVSEVFNRVCARLALHPYEVLDEVYPDDTKG